jgi:thiosulfate reductase cytochrome b subunit
MIPAPDMAEAAYVRGLAISQREAGPAPRHSAVVRITHWITAISFFSLVISGVAILLAHPRLYWGETGARGGPSLIDLPLPFVLDVPIRGPGRYLHFLSAWISLFTGLIYVIGGLFTHHFHRHLLPARSDLGWKQVRQVILDHLRFKRSTKEEALTYNLFQRLTYLLVIFVMFPLMIWTGLAMSPAVTSVFPAIVTVFGGQQSARTIHFLAACFLVLFFVIHIVMVCVAGFTTRVRAMITGDIAATKERI